MTQTGTMMIHYILFTIFSHSLLPWTSTGFTLKLTHRDSPISPLYQSNISDSERFIKNIEISKVRATYLQQQIEVKDVRFPLRFRDPVFTVEIGIGTPMVKRTLIFDTGSSLTWTQCAPCTKCFRQIEPYFVTKKSTSYKTITKKHPLAKSFTCGFSKCTYRNTYYGQTTEGVPATETFTFDTKGSIPNLAFGCGTKSSGNYPGPQISGILGLNRDPISFASQLGSVMKGRFSYCMSSLTTKATYVRFGDEAVIRGRNAQNTPFKKNTALYALNLNDLTVNGQKLGLGQGECLIDTSASISLLNKRTFSAVRAILEKYYAGFNNVQRYVGSKVPKGFICYTETTKMTSFPSLTFNFQGANFDVPVHNIFMYIDSNTFCLAMTESKENKIILGSYQQRNVRIVYNLKEMMFSFDQEDCSKDY